MPRTKSVYMPRTKSVYMPRTKSHSRAFSYPLFPPLALATYHVPKANDY